MKHKFFAALLAIVTCVANAGVIDVSKQNYDSERSDNHVFDLTKAQRALVFSGSARYYGDDGIVYVCPTWVRREQYSGTCVNRNGRQWINMLEHPLYGYKPVAFEIRQHSVIVYYSKVK